MSVSLKIIELKRTRLYSEELGINLWKNEDKELFKWFLASLLFGARISETIAKNTYRTFEKYGLLEPKKIIKAGWDFLVNPIMREGGYVRYDGITSTKVLKNCAILLDNFNGSLKAFHRKAKDRKDLEKSLLDFPGVGPITANIFLRELRPIWEKSDPDPLPGIVELARKHRIGLGRYDRKSEKFIRIEAGLIRARKGRGKDP